MKRRDLLLASAATLVVPAAVRAQTKIPVVGLMWIDSVKPSPFASGLLEALRERGWVAGRDFRVEDRVTPSGYGSLAESAADLTRARVDVIVVNGSTGTVAAAKATQEIPIVMLTGQDPVKLGVARSLSRPAGNVTGIVTLTPDLTGKRIELMKELVPGLSRVGVLLAHNVGNPNFVREAQAAAQRLDLQLHFAEVAVTEEIEDRIAELARTRVGAIHPTPSSLLQSQSARVVASMAKHRIPAVYGNERYAHDGGLMTFSASGRKNAARLAGYVDRILKGARAGDLPIEQVTDLELVVNLKTAKALGLKVPQSILVRADRVIE